MAGGIRARERGIDGARGGPVVRPLPRALHGNLAVFGEPKDTSVLGAYSMEGLRLEVDPHSGRVRRKKRLMAVAVAPA